jgi:hypothetical protein
LAHLSHVAEPMVTPTRFAGARALVTLPVFRYQP